MDEPTLTPDVDQRAPDQDTAVAQAFVAGTLPEEDRRVVVTDLVPEPETVSVSDATSVTLTLDPVPADRGPFQFRSLEDIHQSEGLADRTRRLIATAQGETGYAQRAALEELAALYKGAE